MHSNVGTISSRTTAKVVGALFLIATAAYMLASGLIDSITSAPDLLAQVDSNSSRMEIGVFLGFVTAAANIGIGVLLFPILKKHSETIALGYLITRIFDGAGIIISGMASLSLVAVSRQAIQAGTQGDSSSLALGNLLVAGSDTAYLVTMIALGLGAMPFCYLLYRTRLIPRSLAALGFVGYAALFIGSALELVGIDLRMIHYVPGGLFELLLPLQLIIKGFNPAAANPESSMADVSGDHVGVPAAQTS